MHFDGRLQPRFCIRIGLLRGLGKQLRGFSLPAGLARGGGWRLKAGPGVDPGSVARKVLCRCFALAGGDPHCGRRCPRSGFSDLRSGKRLRRLDARLRARLRVVGGEVQLRLILPAALDDRVDDVSLPSARHLLAHEIPHLFGHFAGHAPGDDGRAAGRQLVQNADVEVAVQTQRQGARNRRGGHHQHVRLGLIGSRLVGLLHQLEALQNPEAVLLIDHHQPQPAELDLLFDERMGPDHQLRLAAIDLAPRRALAVFRERASQ